MSILIRVGMAFIVSAIFLPLAFLGITHGSSFGLESGISLIILNIITRAVAIFTKWQKS